MSYALLSVSNKDGIVDFAKSLVDFGYNIISSGGTYKVISEAGIAATKVSDYTGSPEILSGRVKTLHPKIHGGILARRGDPNHAIDMKSNGIEFIDIVAVNLYPFQETVAKPNVTWEEAIENIDIGGPTMVRSAAKNHANVSILTHPEQYKFFIDALGRNKVSDIRAQLAIAAFQHTTEYDSVIAHWMQSNINKKSNRKIFSL